MVKAGANLKRIADLLFEVGMLKKTPRTGYRFLGTGEESVAEHLFSTAFIGYCLAQLDEGVDAFKVVMMCLFHDLPEARTGDHNYVYKKYVQVDEERAAEDLAAGLPFANEIKGLIAEFNAHKTQEALLSHDADQLALLLQLKEHKDLGSRYADEWLRNNAKRLQTEVAKNMAEAILQTDLSAWWFAQGDADWWIKGK
ncbi:MAG: HD domain-containing protein [Desulfobacterales bacterium]|nr:HD domain-containing protein [Desulfobacterales bacterium]